VVTDDLRESGVTPQRARSPIVRVMRRGGTWLAVTGATLALAACGGDAKPEEPGLPPSVAERLAGESEAIADKLDGGDTCGAAQQADVLENAVERAISAGDVPAELQSELLETARQLQNDVNCPQPPPPPPPAEDCEALEEEKKALEEQKKEAEGEEKEQLEAQIKVLEEQIKACKKGQGDGDEE
jgi:hypothetical protein